MTQLQSNHFTNGESEVEIFSALFLKQDVTDLMCEKTKSRDFKDPLLPQSHSPSLSDAQSSF